ncbi:MAG: hemolysin family protein [Myxococcota bacterium]|nr:hemolysin family protein [Myxococcota bacterium]
MASELLIILLLTLANGLFAGTEIAVLSVRKTRLRQLVEEGNKGAQAVQHLRTHSERFLATVQVGITVVAATSAAFGGAAVAERLEPALRDMGLGDSAPSVALTLVVALVSFLSIVLGELVPKSLALRSSEAYALAMGRPMIALAWLMRPAVWVLTLTSNVVLKLFGDRTSFTESRLSPDELQQLVEEASRTGSVHPRTGDIASRAFDMAELTAGEVMVPRNRVVTLPRRASPEEIQRIMLEEGHSRMPVYDGQADNIVGYVVAKDLLAIALEKGLVVLEDALRPAYFVPETMRALDVMQGMQQRRTLLAVAVDEGGGFAGILTMEDLVEELVGEIFSEHETPPETIRPEEQGVFLVQATLPLRDLNRALDLSLPEDRDFTTLGGLVTSLSGKIPEVGAKLVAEDGTRLEVVDASPRRVKLVRVRPPTRTEPQPDGEA